MGTKTKEYVLHLEKERLPVNNNIQKAEGGTRYGEVAETYFTLQKEAACLWMRCHTLEES